MSHVSLMPAVIGGVKQYLYLTMNKVVGVAAADGQLLWSIPFAAKMAACPSPVSIGDGRIFITSGYEAGSMMIQVQKGASGFTVQKLYDLTSMQFNSEVHTPVLYQNHLFAVSSKTRGRFTCLGLDGKPVWQSPVVSGDPAATRTFELGAFMFADGMFFDPRWQDRHAPPARGQHETVQGTGQCPDPGGRGRVGPAGALQRQAGHS